MSKERLYIFDTTLRDGAQTQGVDFSLDDKVVNPLKTINFISNWGGPTKSINVKMTKFDDKYSHVLAGDIISPNQTQKAKSEILKWVNSLN